MHARTNSCGEQHLAEWIGHENIQNANWMLGFRNVGLCALRSKMSEKNFYYCIKSV